MTLYICHHIIFIYFGSLELKSDMKITAQNQHEESYYLLPIINLKKKLFHTNYATIVTMETYFDL